ncbi:PaaI family thioesterase [Inhella gelatinilytica]|uniref:PaaI family thioesterase n=1 Tax=Inhella gelatinilytica TaxID=2795030 RepID=A0A931IXU6_9BURK|nr:PaaI family thioesterase [Inhella gelatinilytica]MBH9553005.1 PaaI family thioesterase [Inhella gelatinilytica]
MTDVTVTTQSTLETWLTAEEAVRQRQRAHAQPTFGELVKPEEAWGLTGLEILQGMLAGRFPAPPISHTLDFILVDVAEGQAVFQGEPLWHHYNPLGTVHGGWFATLLDSALGCAVHSTMKAGETYTTLEFKLNLVRALKDKEPARVRAIGRVRHRGRQMATAEADLVGPDGKLYAHASTSCLVFPKT